MALTPKQERFVQEYLIDLNATQAYLRAGYKVKPASARVQSCRLLADPNIVAAIERGRQEQSARLATSADDVVREIARLAMFDPAVFKDVKSPEDVAALPENARRAVVGWGWDRQGRFTIKLAKEGALEMLGRHFGLFRDRVEHSGPDGGPIQGTLDVSGLSTAALAEIMRARDAAVGS
jgi:phage terminase small subunit